MLSKIRNKLHLSPTTGGVTLSASLPGQGFSRAILLVVGQAAQFNLTYADAIS